MYFAGSCNQILKLYLGEGPFWSMYLMRKKNPSFLLKRHILFYRQQQQIFWDQKTFCTLNLSLNPQHTKSRSHLSYSKRNHSNHKSNITYRNTNWLKSSLSCLANKTSQYSEGVCQTHSLASSLFHERFKQTSTSLLPYKWKSSPSLKIFSSQLNNEDENDRHWEKDR